MSMISRIIILLFLLITPIIALYAYSHKQTVDVMESQIDQFNRTRMAYFMDQIDRSVQSISFYAYGLMNDPDIKLFSSRYLTEYGFNRYQIRANVENKLVLMNGFNAPWENLIALYFPEARTVIANGTSDKFDEEALKSLSVNRWVYESTNRMVAIERNYFTRLYVTSNLKDRDILQSRVIVQVSLPADNIVTMLNTFKTSGINDPFYFSSSGEVIYNDSADKELIGQLISHMQHMEGEQHSKVITLNGKSYSVFVEKSKEMNWVLADYVPLEDILKPVNQSKVLFYFIVVFLLLLGIAASLMLYTQIQIPIKLLIQNVRKFKEGKFTTRIASGTRHEFRELFDQFNEMATEIQDLVERVYVEEIRSKEAMMKQLQSQINPHFLYNCFANLISMAKMKRNDAIIAMSHNLADYYKYATRNENLMTTVDAEIKFISHYLDIINMQVDRFHYSIEPHMKMDALSIPRLLIQPLVENAVVHGLEPKVGEGHIRIRCEEKADGYVIAVEDDGIGMTDMQLARLNSSIASSDPVNASCGLWNVRQRLVYSFGPKATLRIDHSDMGGVKAEMYWNKSQ